MTVTDEHKELKWQESIDLLNDIIKVKIAPSDIHGVGVFAIQDIKRGERLYLDSVPNSFDLPYEKFDQLKPNVRQKLLEIWPQVINGSHFLYPITRVQAFLNHSDKPNYDAFKDKALRKIKKGEEVTEDYRKIKNWEVIFPWLK